MKMKTKSLAIILIFFKFIINSDERLVVTGADEPVYAHAGEDVTLSCSVDTHVNVAELQVEWRKTDDDGDILVLLYAEGENRPESQDGRYSGRAEFFTEEFPKGNFSMKLRKVRLEDKGDFICKVHSDTDSASTTARIAALGYSPLHWLILWLCMTVIPVVLLTGALSVWYYIKKSKGRQALLSHWSHVTVPPIMVSSAFILWGVTEGSTEEAVTCTVITLLNILMLFNMYSKPLYPGLTWKIGFLTQTVGSIIIIITAVFIVPIVEFSTKYSATTAGKVTLGVFVGGFVLVMIFMASVQFLLYFMHLKFLSLDVWRENLKKILWALSAFLIITVLVAVGVGVFLANYLSGRAKIADIGLFLTVIIVPMIVFLIPLIGFGILMIRSLRTEVGCYRFLCLFHSLIMMLNIQIIPTLYIQLISWMQGTFLLGYFIPIIVASLGICVCFIAKLFLESFRHFYLFQKILLGILFPLHLILSLLYLSLVLDNDKVQTTERPVKICEFVFIYILIVTNNDDWNRKEHLVKTRKYVNFSGAFALPLLNSAALAVALKLKADTGKQPLDLRLIVLISGSVFLFSWFVVQMSAYCMDKIDTIKEAVTQIRDVDPDQPELIQERLELLKHADSCQWAKQNCRELWSCSSPHCATMRKVLEHMTECHAGASCQVKHCASSRRIISENKDYYWDYIEIEAGSDSSDSCGSDAEEGSHANEETVASSPPEPNGPNTEEGSHDNLEMKLLSSADHNEPNTERSHDDQEMEPLSPADHNEPNTEVTEESSTGI